MTAPSSKKSYFNLHITGLGYVKRIREITPRRGDPFVCCEIAALSGPTDSVEYRYFDCKVSGHDAEHLIRRCQDAVNEGRKVLIGFRLGDPWIDRYTITKGLKTGETGVSLKARLLFITWIKVEGTKVYTAESKPTDDAADQASDDALAAPAEESPPSAGVSTDGEVNSESPAQAA